jgi:transposase
MKQHHFTEVEMKRYHLLQEVQNGHLTLAQAASLMGVSYRHAIRLKQRFLQQGVQGLKRRQPAQPPHQKITPQVKQTILQLRQSIYYDFNLRHFQEKLALHHHIYLGYETLRQLLIQAGLHQPRQKRKVYRRRRRMPCAGMLVQMGSCDGNAWGVSVGNAGCSLNNAEGGEELLSMWRSRSVRRV